MTIGMETQPKIDLKKKKRVFGGEKGIDEKFFNMVYGDDFEENNVICKIQELNELSKTKHYFNLVYKYDGVICHGLGNRCYLFEEDGKVKIKTLKEDDDIKTFNTKFGLMTTIFKGEWGGALYIKSEDEGILVGLGDYVHVFEYADKVYALTTLSHLLGYECSIHEIKKINGGFENIRIFNSSDLDFAGYCSEGKYVYFYSQSYKFEGLYRFDLENNELKLICEDLCKDISVNSLIKKDDFIYIYGNYNLIRYELNTSKIETYTNLEYNQISKNWYVNDEKLIDIWDKIVEL